MSEPAARGAQRPFARRGGLLLAAVLGFVCAVPAARAASASAPPATLAQALDRALEQRLEIRTARALADAAGARVDQARAAYRPSARLGGEFDYTRAYDAFTGITATATLPQLGTVSVDVQRTVPRYQFVPTLRLEYEAYDGGRRDALLERSLADAQSASMTGEVAARVIARETGEAFFALRRACILQRGAARQASYARRRREVAAQRQSEGRVTEMDVQAAQLTERERALNVRGAALQVDAARGRLDDVLGTPAAAPQARADADACNFASTPQQDLAALSGAAGGQPELARAEHDWQAARQQIAATQALARPQVSLFAQYAGIGRSSGNSLQGVDELRRRDATVGVLLTYTLYDGGRIDARAREDAAEAERLRLEFERLAQDLARGRERALLQVQRLQTDAALASERAGLARDRRALAETRLAAGTGTAAAVEAAVLEEADALDQVQVGEIDLAIARIAELFPAR